MNLSLENKLALESLVSGEDVNYLVNENQTANRDQTLNVYEHLKKIPGLQSLVLE